VHKSIAVSADFPLKLLLQFQRHFLHSCDESGPAIKPNSKLELEMRTLEVENSPASPKPTEQNKTTKDAKRSTNKNFEFILTLISRQKLYNLVTSLLIGDSRSSRKCLTTGFAFSID
jgi:hypothetical protein